jgi:hypothetical protein
MQLKIIIVMFFAKEKKGKKISIEAVYFNEFQTIPSLEDKRFYHRQHICLGFHRIKQTVCLVPFSAQICKCTFSQNYLEEEG